MNQFLFSAELAEKIFNYLITRPCQETMQLVQELQKLTPHVCKEEQKQDAEPNK